MLGAYILVEGDLQLICKIKCLDILNVPLLLLQEREKEGEVFFLFCNFLFSTFVLYTKQHLIEVTNYPNLYDGERI